MRFKELDEVQELGRYCPSATRLPARLSATGAEAPVICVLVWDIFCIFFQRTLYRSPCI